MAYVAQGMTDEQARELTQSLDMARLKALSPEQKVDMLLRQQSIKAEKRRAFWEAVASGMTLLAFLGLSSGGRR